MSSMYARGTATSPMACHFLPCTLLRYAGDLLSALILTVIQGWKYSMGISLWRGDAHICSTGGLLRAVVDY